MDDDVNTAHVVRSGNKVGVSSKQKRDGIVYTYILSCCAATVAESGMNVARRMPQFVLLFNFVERVCCLLCTHTHTTHTVSSSS